MITTTLNRIREYPHDVYPYVRSRDWEKLLAGLGKTKPDDKPLPYADIVRICGLDYAIWTLRAEPKHANKWRLLAIRFARDVEHLMTDPRSVAALDAANNHASSGLCYMELIKARMAAWGEVPSPITPTERPNHAAQAH